MGIKQITTDVAGQVDVRPRRVKIISSDGVSTVSAAGYLNGTSLEGYTIDPTDVIDMWYSYVSPSNPGTYGVFTPSITNGVITLNAWANPGEVTLPVVNNDFCNFSGTVGVIKDSGYSPSDAAKTKVVMAGSAVVSGRIAHFVDTTGTIDDTAGAVVNAGDIYAGLDAVAGVLRSYPATTATGYLGVTGVSNSGAFTVQVANVSHGQSTVHSIPDPVNAAARFLVGATATPFTSGNFPVASGTGGLMVDSGLSAANIQNKTNIKAATTADIGGGGAGPITVSVAGLTAASVVVATVESSSNAVSVIKCTAGTGNFDITFSGDPGAACLVNYIAFIAAQ